MTKEGPSPKKKLRVKGSEFRELRKFLRNQQPASKEKPSKYIIGMMAR